MNTCAAMVAVRLPALAIALVAGIALAEQAGPLAHAPAVWLSALALVALAGAGRAPLRRARWIVTAALAGAAASARVPVLALDAPAGTVPDDASIDRITGTIHGPVTRAGDRGGGRLVTEPDGVAIWVWAPLPLAPG